MSTYDDIIERHAAEARREIEAEQRKTADQRKAEALSAELGTLSATIATHQKQPSKFRVELAAAYTRQAEVIRELQAMGAMPADRGRQYHTPTMYDPRSLKNIGRG
jgi:hypothetical protein